MTPEAQRIAIAAACGWTLCRADNKTWRTPEQKAKNLELLGHENGPWNFESSGPPDYPNDLNAMHEAEKALTLEQWDKYIDRLDDWVPSMRNVAHATASERAEAFLRTLNLWTDEQ